jgi:hypothetical protein
MPGRDWIALFALLVLPGLASSQSHPVPEILSMWKKAAGGDAWNDVKTLHTVSRIGAAGLTGRAESWTELATGHFLDRYALGPASGGHGFDGSVSWIQDGSGLVRIEDNADARQESADESYRRSVAVWFPERHAAEILGGGDGELSGRRGLRLRITPAGGRPFDVWIDAKSSLPIRIVEKGPEQTQTTRLADYRPIHGIWLPFDIRATNGNPRFDQELSVENVEVNVPISDGAFAPPKSIPPPPN